MTRGPRRLKDDPDFKWETGCDVADEARVVGGYDHETSRSRLLAAVALLPAVTVGDGVPTVRPGASAWKMATRPLVGAVAGAMVVAAAYWLGVQSGTDEGIVRPAPPVQSAPVNPPTELAAPPSDPASRPNGSAEPVTSPETHGMSTAPAPETVSVKVDPVAPPGPAKVVSSARELGQREVAVVAAPGVGEAEPEIAVDAPTVAADVPAASGTAESDGASAAKARQERSQIQIEQAVLEPADDALEMGRFGVAREGFEGYLARFPNGKMIVEAQWGLLQSIHGEGDTAGTEALARTLQDLPAFAARREDILRLRAESLVRLDRCDDALLVAEGMASRTAADIRRACRQPHRGLP